jgi:hypothetical protein
MKKGKKEERKAKKKGKQRRKKRKERRKERKKKGKKEREKKGRCWSEAREKTNNHIQHTADARSSPTNKTHGNNMSTIIIIHE